MQSTNPSYNFLNKEMVYAVQQPSMKPNRISFDFLFLFLDNLHNLIC